MYQVQLDINGDAVSIEHFVGFHVESTCWEAHFSHGCFLYFIAFFFSRGDGARFACFKREAKRNAVFRPSESKFLQTQRLIHTACCFFAHLACQCLLLRNKKIGPRSCGSLGSVESRRHPPWRRRERLVAWRRPQSLEVGPCPVKGLGILTWLWSKLFWDPISVGSCTTHFSLRGEIGMWPYMMGQNETTRIWTAGFSPWFHLPGFHFGVTLLLTRTHMNLKWVTCGHQNSAGICVTPKPPSSCLFFSFRGRAPKLEVGFSLPSSNPNPQKSQKTVEPKPCVPSNTPTVGDSGDPPNTPRPPRSSERARRCCWPPQCWPPAPLWARRQREGGIGVLLKEGPRNFGAILGSNSFLLGGDLGTPGLRHPLFWLRLGGVLPVLVGKQDIRFWRGTHTYLGNVDPRFINPVQSCGGRAPPKVA